MLKIELIKFKDQKNRTYEIKKHQIETFPLTGGEDADMVTTQVWNQHGNTPTNAFMEAFEGELVFAIFTGNKKPNEIAAARREVADICNPLNGTLRMTVTLNNGETYNRDITIVSAPIFPTGHQNRNREWQKVQLLYSANNPFWYSENEIVESFQGVEPLFTFPFELGGKNDFTIEDGYLEKISGSLVENSNVILYDFAPELPTAFDGLGELNQSGYEAAMFDGGVRNVSSTDTVGNRVIYLFRYNIPDILEKHYGEGIWEGAVSTADKIAKADALINKMSFYQKGYAFEEEDPVVYNISLGLYAPATTSWFTLDYTWSEETSYGISTTGEGRMDAGGYVTFASFTPPSDGTLQKLYCQYAYCKIELTLANTDESVIFGNIIPNKIAINEGQVQAPVIIEIDGYCVNPEITNATTGEFIRFKDLTMNTGDKLIIDTSFGQKRVELNGENVFNKLDFSSTFFNLKIGENSIDFSDETGSQEARISFIYKNLYITI